MNKLITKTRDFIFTQQTSIISSTLVLAGMILLSRVAGFMRYRILTSYFTKEYLDIFFAAFRIPDLVFEVLINGALSTTFIPFFIQYQKRPEEQSVTISSIINTVLVALGVFILVLLIFMPQIIYLITPGFSGKQISEIIFYSRLLLIGQLPFLVLGNFLTGISQAKKSFLLPALAPIIYNIAIICATLLFAKQISLFAPILGVVVGAFLFFIIQIPVLFFVNFKYVFVIRNLQEAWRFFRTAIPRILTIIVAQIDATIDLTLTTLLGSGSYTIFYFAQHLQLLPISIVGMAFGQASLPYLSDMYEEKKFEELRKIIVDSILNIFFITVPFAAFFILARTPIVRLFYGGEKFDWDATVLTANTLSYFAMSIPIHSIYYFLTRCFYAVFDTKTPFYIAVISILFNAILSLIFILVLHLPVWSLAIAFSVAITLQVSFLLVFLYKKVGNFDLRLLVREIIKIVLAGMNTAILTYFLMRLLDGLIFDTSRTLNVFLLILTGVIFYMTVYIFMSWMFEIKAMYIISKILLKAKEYRKKMTELYKGVE